MPRLTPEARIATNIRTRLQRPAPPANLSPEAKGHWRKIVEARPVDYFKPGNLQLLESYCRTLPLLNKATEVLEHTRPEDIDLFALQSRTVARLTGMATALAVKLRLTVQSTTRTDSGILNEGGGVAGRSPLLGGNVTQLRPIDG
jgi:phage terminase small subunit